MRDNDAKAIGILKRRKQVRVRNGLAIVGDFEIAASQAAAVHGYVERFQQMGLSRF
jgi:hypothetical protein